MQLGTGKYKIKVRLAHTQCDIQKCTCKTKILFFLLEQLTEDSKEMINKGRTLLDDIVKENKGIFICYMQISHKIGQISCNPNEFYNIESISFKWHMELQLVLESLLRF